MLFAGCTAFGGPITEFGDFLDWANVRGDYAQMRPFSNFLPALKRLGHAFGFMILAVLAEEYTPKNEVYDDAANLEQYSFGTRFYMLSMTTAWTIIKLIFVFLVQESCLVASGLGYKAKTEKESEDFNSMRCAKVFDCVFATEPAGIVANWNMRTQYWLKYYVMIPLLDRSKPKNATQIFPVFITFLTSALWHGFYFGYYGTFIGFALAVVMWKMFGATKLA